MASNVLAIRMKFRKYSEEELNNVINNEESSEKEVEVATELLEKLGGAPEAPAKTDKKKATKEEPEKKAAPKKTAPKKDEPEPEEEGDTEEGDGEEQLTEEEKARLAKAEKEFDERQKNRKTPSKTDKAMSAPKKKESKEPRETKRQNLEESTEVPGLKVGSKVTLKGETTVGEVTRLYQSGDGKEKCMVKFGDDKPIKKRVTALELSEEKASAPAKKVPGKKK